MHSAIYTGVVKHSRLLPRKHEFLYPISMFYLSYQELPEINKLCSWLSIDKFNILSFNKKNYLSTEAILQHIRSKNFSYASTNIFILTNLSFLGYCYNPVSFYYCYDSNNKDLQYILAEVNNTPWDERHVYVLDCKKPDSEHNFELEKKFHISPFMPMDMHYKWLFSDVNEQIRIKLQNYTDHTFQFEANLVLVKNVLTKNNVIKHCLKFPFTTQKTLWRIYWQALKLWLKRIPFYSHPRKINE